jgi:hypothetical protein
MVHAEQNHYFTLVISCRQQVEQSHGKLVSCVEFTSYEYSGRIDTRERALASAFSLLQDHVALQDPRGPLKRQLF